MSALPVVGIIDYQAGNIHSIQSAFEALGVSVRIICKPNMVDNCSHVVLPGVGAFGYCIGKLHESGLLPRLERWAITEQRPMLGICVGMQLLARYGMELGRHNGLGWLDGQVLQLHAKPPAVRVPHVGWNNVNFLHDFGSFKRGDAPDFYFDHSFAFFSQSDDQMIGKSDHGVSFSTVVRRDNIIATQFHPEKSQEAGLRFLDGFLQMSPQC